MLFKTEPVEEINSILMNYVAPPPAPLQQLQNNIQGFQRIKMEVKQEPNTGYDHGDYSTGGQALQGNPGPFVLGGGLPQLHGQTSKNVHGTCSLGNFCIMSTYKRKDRAPYKVYCGTCGAEFHCFCLGRSNSPLTNKEFHCCGIKAICSAKKAKQGIYFHKRTVQVRNFRVKSEISVYGSFNF
uniref:Nuclear receptor domain-containing protein n=2 Tax=Caenorhabditis tropicalis TaxID=1561998 RepID=A0A1I7TLS1_9PELO